MVALITLGLFKVGVPPALPCVRDGGVVEIPSCFLEAPGFWDAAPGPERRVRTEGFPIEISSV